MRHADTLILGGGPAGCAAALRLARAGKRPLLIERARGGPEIVCGGFLAGDAIQLLRSMGADPFELGAEPATRLRLAAGRRTATIDLPFAAAGLSRRTLDAALRTKAAEAGAQVECGVSIRSCDPARREVSLSDGGTIRADTLFIATGKHELRGIVRSAARTENPSIGLRQSMKLHPAQARQLSGHLELYLFRQGYAGLILHDGGEANLCMSVQRSRLRDAGNDPARLLDQLCAECPPLGDRLGGADRGSGWSSIAHTPYGWLGQQTEDGVYRLGDQAAVIASLAGDGIALALGTGTRAADDWLRAGPGGAQPFQLWVGQNYRRPIRIASGLRASAMEPRLAGHAVQALRLMPGLARLLARLTRTEAY